LQVFLLAPAEVHRKNYWGFLSPKALMMDEGDMG